MNTETSPLKTAVKAAGGYQRFAESLGISPSKWTRVQHWVAKNRVPPEYAPDVAQKYGIPIDQICPDVPWHKVRVKDHAA